MKLPENLTNDNVFEGVTYQVVAGVDTEKGRKGVKLHLHRALRSRHFRRAFVVSCFTSLPNTPLLRRQPKIRLLDKTGSILESEYSRWEFSKR